GALLSAVMIGPALELAGQSIRARFDAQQIDLGYFHPDSLLTLIDPDYYGLLSGHYSGPGDSTQHYFYAGILLVPLAIVGAGNRRPRREPALESACLRPRSIRSALRRPAAHAAGRGGHCSAAGAATVRTAIGGSRISQSRAAGSDRNHLWI